MLQLCMCVWVCVWAVWYVCTILPCAFLNVSVFVWFIYINASSYICVCVCVCCQMCVFCWLWRETGGVDGAVDRRWGAPACECVFYLIFFRSPLACLCVCMCVCCLFTYPPPGQEFPDELCLWQVGSFGKSDTHRTNITHSLLAPFLLSHTSISPFIPWFLFRVSC